MTSKNVEAVQAMHVAFNARDWKSMQSLIAEDCVFVDGRGVAHNGPEAAATTCCLALGRARLAL